MGFSYKIILISLLFLYSCDDFFLSDKDECGVIGGDNSSCMDECGVVNGNGVPEGYCDCEGNVLGCDGECGSGQEYDVCGVCNGNAVSEYSCDCEDPGQIRDCLGECGGLAVIDQCGICNGDNSLCTGCMISGSDNFSANNIIANNELCFVDYTSSIQTVFDNHCTGCHGGGAVNLESYFNTINSDIIQIGDSSNSRLWQVVEGDSPSMPPSGPLNNSDVRKIALWIHFGAQESN